jgi:5-formyltetrahydrofolate cyclo-ligase
MKDLRASLSTEERNIFNNAIRQRLFDLPAYKGYSKIFTYVSFQTEIDTRTILSNAWENNKRVFVPRVEGKEMDFYEIHTAEFLVPSKFGVPEPEKDEKKRYIGVEEYSEIKC